MLTYFSTRGRVIGMLRFAAAAVAIAAWTLGLAAVALLPVAPLFGDGWDYFYLVDVVNAVVYGALAWLLLCRHGGVRGRAGGVDRGVWGWVRRGGCGWRSVMPGLAGGSARGPPAGPSGSGVGRRTPS
jgi:hypothetical protein